MSARIRQQLGALNRKDNPRMHCAGRESTAEIGDVIDE